MNRLVEGFLLPGVVVLVGLLSCIGYVFANELLVGVGQVSAASPLPLPFYDIKGAQENFSYTGVLAVTSNQGVVVSTPLQLTDLAGPHRRKIAYVAALQSWQIMTPLAARVIEYGFCQPDNKLLRTPLAQDPSRVTLYLYAYDDAETPAQTSPVVCRTS